MSQILLLFSVPVHEVRSCVHSVIQSEPARPRRASGHTALYLPNLPETVCPQSQPKEAPGGASDTSAATRWHGGSVEKGIKVSAHWGHGQRKKLGILETTSRIVLCMRPANERQRYSITFLIGWAQAQNWPWSFSNIVQFPGEISKQQDFNAYDKNPRYAQKCFHRTRL